MMIEPDMKSALDWGTIPWMQRKIGLYFQYDGRVSKDGQRGIEYLQLMADNVIESGPNVSTASKNFALAASLADHRYYRLNLSAFLLELAAMTKQTEADYATQKDS